MMTAPSLLPDVSHVPARGRPDTYVTRGNARRRRDVCVEAPRAGYSECMYIGLGTLVFILLVVMIVYFVRRA
jgi:hypothetical protein